MNVPVHDNEANFVIYNGICSTFKEQEDSCFLCLFCLVLIIQLKIKTKIVLAKRHRVFRPNNRVRKFGGKLHKVHILITYIVYLKKPKCAGRLIDYNLTSDGSYGAPWLLA